MDLPSESEGAPVALRLLIVIHGHEPDGWAQEACRTVSMLQSPTVRVLAVMDLTFPPFTSLTPGARRMYQHAIGYWTHDQEWRIQKTIDEILPVLPPRSEVVRLHCPARRLCDAVKDQVETWRATAVLTSMQSLDRILPSSTSALVVTPRNKDDVRN